MLIKSPFKDYYDGVQQFGQDDIIYVRYPKEITDIGYVSTCETYVGFAGKIYPVLTLSGHRCVTIKDVDKVVDSGLDYVRVPIFSKQSKKIYYDGDEQGRYNGRYFTSYTRAKLIKWFANESISDRWGGRSKDKSDWHNSLVKKFDQYNAPIFTIEQKDRNNVKVELNACLRPYEIFRVLPPYEAFQNLHMWLCNQARPIREAPPIDDKTMSEIKGFDKYSFRKQKSK